MAEYLQSAWTGWTGYTDNGKLPALLMAVLLFLWFGRKKREQAPFLVYTSVMTVCCILPVTAALLMLYQTKFYRYEWIWSLVPVTAIIAYGLTCAWTEYRAENKGQWKKTVPVTLLLLTLLLFCGSLGGTLWDRDTRKEERITAYSVLIMEYAREKDAGILLPYGRNIRNGFLNAYSYDVYQEDTVMLEQWMEHMSMTGEPDMETELPSRYVVTLETCVEKALEQGVNCILITGEASDNALARIEKVLEIKAEALEGYYLFLVQ